MTYYILCTALITGPRYDILDSDGFITVRRCATLKGIVSSYFTDFLRPAKEFGIKVAIEDGVITVIHTTNPEVVTWVVAETTSLSTLSDTHPELFL